MPAGGLRSSLMTVTDAPTLRDRKKQQTRIDLVAAALALFEDRGYHATSIDDIAARANCSRRTFFRYFDSKEDVAFGDGLERLAQFRSRLEGSAPAEDAVQDVCDLLREQTLAFTGDPVDQATVELWFREPVLRRRYTEIVLSWEEAAAAYIAASRGTDPESDVVAQIVATALCGVAKAALQAGLQGQQAAEATLTNGFALVLGGVDAALRR
ncbi:MAG: sle [Solirubrobacterales bacterium]|nr:sle [Solirubrobacterales bacterium]